MYRKAIVTSAALTLSMAAGLAHAQSNAAAPGWYGGIDLGRSRLGVSGSDLDGALSRQGITASSTNERSDTSYAFSVGYRINRNLAIEGAYAKLGEFSYNSASSAPAADSISGKYEAKAFSISAIGIMPLQQNWSVYGKAGLAQVRTHLDASSALGTTAPSNTTDSGSSLLIGAGAMYDFNRNIFARAGWDRYTSVGSDATGKGAIDLYSVGVGYRF
jgi:opacity protein-like surface antigen